jgi:hypothetical protein
VYIKQKWKSNPEGGKKNRVEMLLILKLGIYVLQLVPATDKSAANLVQSGSYTSVLPSRLLADLLQEPDLPFVSSQMLPKQP